MMKSSSFNGILLAIFAITTLAAVPAQAVMIDLTSAGSSGSVNGAIFQQIAPQPTGTGYIDSFVRIQNKGTEKGFNTDGAPQYDTMGGAFTHSIRVADVPLVTVGGVNYRQFMLDINETKTDTGRYLSLDSLKISEATTGNLTSNLGKQLYSLDKASADNFIKLDYALNNGSGSGDMAFLLADSLFTNDQMYVYLFSEFGLNYGCDAGFEEWATQQSGCPSLVPEPTTLALVAAGFGLAGLTRRRRIAKQA